MTEGFDPAIEYGKGILIFLEDKSDEWPSTDEVKEVCLKLEKDASTVLPPGQVFEIRATQAANKFDFGRKRRRQQIGFGWYRNAAMQNGEKIPSSLNLEPEFDSVAGYYPLGRFLTGFSLEDYLRGTA